MAEKDSLKDDTTSNDGQEEEVGFIRQGYFRIKMTQLSRGLVRDYFE